MDALECAVGSLCGWSIGELGLVLGSAEANRNLRRTEWFVRLSSFWEAQLKESVDGKVLGLFVS